MHDNDFVSINDLVWLDYVVGIEVYSTGIDAPAEFHSASDCPVVVVWTSPDARALAVCAAALSAAVIGVIMALSQELPVATESPLWSIGAVLWGVLLALALTAAPHTAPSPAAVGVAASDE